MEEIKYIRRTDAINACYQVLNGNKIPTINAVKDVIKGLESISLPKPGRWVEKEDEELKNNDYKWWECSNCGYEISMHKDSPLDRYCSYCGTRMRNGEW